MAATAVLVLAAGTGALTGPATIAEPSAPAAAAAVPALASAAAAGPRRTVSYDGVHVSVPAAWPVVDLAANPHTCVRFDQPVVYLGAASADQDCPAHLIGRADTLWIGPQTASERAADATARAGQLDGRSARVVRDDQSASQVVSLPAQHLSVRTTWADSPDTVDAAVSSATVDGDTTAPLVDSGNLAVPLPATAAGSDMAPAAYLTAAPSVSGTRLTGMAFDACTAPSLATMQAWKANSPYAAVGIYIGGSLRACSQSNLTASWVSSVTAMGWGLIPIFVGRQAPCNTAGLAHFSATDAADTGKTAADDAAAAAAALGLAAGSTIYYDMEYYPSDGYNANGTTCTDAVLTFVTAWSSELHAKGLTSGTYGNLPMMGDMATAMTTHTPSTFVAPDQVWFAQWNGLQTVSDVGGNAAFPDSAWSGHRLHQYAGGVTQTWGGVSINIDQNWVDTTLPGRATQLSYGPGIVGPGSAGFVFTGNMSYWRGSAGTGVKGVAYWTHPNAASTPGGTVTEYNGATWTPSLGVGLYAVAANVPATTNAGWGRYTLTSASGTSSVDLDQSAGTGYRSLGQVLVQPGKPASVHLADNSPKNTSTSTSLWADAVRFTLLATLPSAPTSVVATPSEGSATVRWAAAAANGSAVTSYTVTASPGGARATVGGTATSATVIGLTDNTGYTFTVTATNAIGTSATSLASASVVPIATRTRMAGTDRYATSVAVSQAQFPHGTWPDDRKVSTVVVATGQNFPDALAAGPLAGQEGPLLLVPSTGTVPSVVLAEIARLAPTRIIVVGGTGAVSASVVAQLSRSAPVTRIASSNRYATAAAVATAAAAAITTATGSAPKTVFLASGQGFPDGLAAGAAASATNGVLLLTTSTSVPSETAAALGRIKPATVYLVGGTGVMSSSVQSAIQRLVPTAKVVRLGGADRYATSALVSRTVFGSAPAAVLATGLNYPDALSAAVVNAVRSGPTVLTMPACVPSTVVTEVQRLGVSRLDVVGGTASVSDRAMNLTPC